LAVNTSTHGYGYAPFAARRLNQDIVSAFAILQQREVQQACGVSTPYAVIERVSALEFGVATDIARYRTRAEAGKRILDILARNSAKWSREPRQPLFRSAKDRDALIQSVEQWLAVTDVGDDEVGDLSPPKES